MQSETHGENSRLSPLYCVIAAALVLTVLFWRPFWEGGSLIGGDTYSYFFPQKTFFADRLAAGEFPLWHNRTGFGYPIVAESQTGVLYPPNQVFYRLFDANSAYLANQLLHYVLAFVFTWLYARRLGLTAIAAAFAALIYTYGWFPPRICLEWAIIGGAWLPATLWAVEAFLQTRHWRWLFILTFSLAAGMLAGHFNLAFITQLTLVAYVPLRLWFADDNLPPATARIRGRCAVGIAVAVLLGFAMAAVQLAPTWELRSRSQRSTSANTGYGHLPAWYWSQVVAPWMWYRTDVDLDGLLNRDLPPGAPLTNKIEAHLYFGFLPVIIVLAAAVWKRRELFSRTALLWILLGAAALIYTPGWLLPLTEHLPGFSFFMGPGRYGIVVTLAFALLAGRALQLLGENFQPAARWAVIVVAFAATTADLHYVSRVVTNVVMLPFAPLQFADDSPVRKILAGYDQPTRLYAPGANLTNILGTSAYPVYLGLGPQEYFDPELPLPAPFSLQAPPPADQLSAVQQAGVTHIISGRPLESLSWPLHLVWSGVDPFLHRAWARSPQQPLYLYELTDTRGRVSWQIGTTNNDVDVRSYRANQVVLQTSSEEGGRLVLRDLAYPGWEVDIDGQPAPALTVDRLYRGVDVPPGEHTVTWNYRPAYLYWGAALSGATLLLWAILGHFRFWSPHRFSVFEPPGNES